MKRSILLPCFMFLPLLACDDSNGPSSLPAPVNLIYTLDASGDPDVPSGVLLEWDAVNDPDLRVYNVYSRADGSNIFDLRGSTTSLSFHDTGVPDIEYYVTAVDVDGNESVPSETVFIDERLRLERPDELFSISLDGAVHLAWSDNAFLNEPEGFERYRVYSSSYSLDDVDCGDDWVVEGTTVSPEFVVSALANGFSRCFAVSAESIEGWESLWSSTIADTPRPDARNVLMTRFGFDAATSGFRFFLDGNQDGQASPSELGLIVDGGRQDIDFYLAESGGDIFFFPVRAGTEIALYSSQPIEDLTSIDVAPEIGFSVTPIEAAPGFGYVFLMDGGDGFARFGAIRVTHVGADYIIFDWSYQTDPGNPELLRHGGQATSDGKPLVVTGVK